MGSGASSTSSRPTRSPVPSLISISPHTREDFLKSGSKRGPTRPSDAPRELRPWQNQVLDALASTALASQATFGGATALAVVYLHHRRSDDLDFFLLREATTADAELAARSLRKAGFSVELQSPPLRQMLVLRKGRREVGHVDLASYPYDPVDRQTKWRGWRVDSLLDFAVNKVQAVMTRARERDFVDLYFLLREGPEPDFERLLGLSRAKFEVGPTSLTAAQQLMRVESVIDMPRLIRPLALDELKRFFVELARRLVKRAPGT